MSDIKNERLAVMIADQTQFAGWTDDGEERADALEMVAALQELARMRTENERLQSELAALDSAQREIKDLRCPADCEGDRHACNVCGTPVRYGERHTKCGQSVMALQKEIARLSSPPQERKDIQERQAIRKAWIDGKDGANLGPAHTIGSILDDFDALLQDLARGRNALDDRVRMLGIVQDSLSERNRQNVQLRAKCERLEADNKRLCDVDSENAGLEYGLDEADIECAELRQRIERLEGALQDAHDWIQGFANGGSRPHMDGRKLLANAKAALAASQHTAGSGDGVAGD